MHLSRSIPNTRLNRYIRNIECDERGIINCLSRETKAYCDCMNDKKREVKGMDKTEFCVGCKIYFPRDGMMKCKAAKLQCFVPKTASANTRLRTESITAMQNKNLTLRFANEHKNYNKRQYG